MMADGLAPLFSVIAHARSGALDHAWKAFDAAGFRDVTDDPAVLSVRGRLLKDRANRSAGGERQSLYREAAAAYAGAAALSDDSYPLINAATLALLGGDVERSQELARQVLARIEAGTDNSETPYYREATRAEALLLTGSVDAARAALAAAVALAPRAWEDHASTLRQFALILPQQGQDAGWLDPLRPPRSLHFAGHMAVGAAGPAHDAARAEVAALLDAEKVGFGYGALAAGADIVIAEALLARGAELHLVIPGSVDRFVASSVAAAGDGWRGRFDAVLERAETVRAIPPFDAPLSSLAVGLANEIAMGAALMNAARLATEAIQLLVVDGAGAAPADAGGTAQAGATWARNERRQLVVVAPRDAAAIGSLDEAGDGSEPVRAAALAIELPGRGIGDAAASAAVGEALARLREALAGAPDGLATPQLSADRLLVACASPAEAAGLVERIRAAWPAASVPRMGADYGIGYAVRDPFTDTLRLHGRLARLAAEAMRSTPPGSVCVTEDFATALEASGGRSRTELVGELAAAGDEGPISLYSLVAAPPPVR